jgi:hypothetical protein
VLHFCHISPEPAPARKLLKFLETSPIAAIFPRVRFGAVQYLILMCAVLQCLTQIKMRELMTVGAKLAGEIFQSVARFGEDEKLAALA